MDIKLNLIPPAKREEIKKTKRQKTIIKAEMVLAVIFLAFYGVLLSFQYVLNIDLASENMLNSEMEQANQFSKIRRYNVEFKKANDQIRQVASIDKNQLYWSKVFMKLGQLIIPGISLKNFSTDNYSVTVSGTADTRDNLLSFKDNLEKEECFSDINLPLSNLVDKTDVEFKIIFNVKESCLAK